MMCKVNKRQRIRKRTGEVVEFYTVRFRDQHGSEHEIVAGPKKKCAEALADKIRMEVNAGTFTMRPKKRLDFKSHCEAYLEYAKASKKHSTWQDYRSVIENHLLPYFKREPLLEITPSVVKDFLDHLNKKGVSRAMAGKCLRVLKLVLRDAVSQELIARDPCVTIRSPLYEKKEMLYLIPDEAMLLIEAGDGEMQVLLATAILSALRLGELLALTWGKLDFDRGLIWVTASWRRGQGITSPKTKSSVRSVPICETLKRYLLDHYEKSGMPSKDEPVFFPSIQGDRHNPVRKGFEIALTKSKVTKIRFHDLRHTAAALMIEAGVDIVTLQRIMGHSSVSITMSLYGHLYSSSYDRAKRSLDRLMGESGNIVRLPLRKDDYTAQADQGS